MADNLSYSPSGHYIPSYYPSSQPPTVSNALDLAALPRADSTQRRRPKYTRSKTGCMTCRQKKIKCDENKPKCHRCAHGQRDCTWPVGVETRKRAPPKRTESTQLDLADVRPSTASSSGISEGSTPPTRNHTPPKREPLELDLPPLALRRHGSDFHGQPHHPHGHSMTSLMDPGHRSSLLPVSTSSQFHNPSSHPSSLSMIPELPNSYLTLPPVDQLYTAPPQYSSSAALSGITRVTQTSGSNYRYYESTPSMPHWMPQPASAPPQLEPMDSYFSHAQDRFPAGTTSSDTQPNRYH